MVPNYGAEANNYFETSVKVPHGSSGKETTKITLHVPNGVLSVAPEDKAGWEVVTKYRDIEPYVSHGATISTAPETISWVATCTGDDAPDSCDNEDHAGLDSGHLLSFKIQTKLGCTFGADSLTGAATTDATVWQEEYTLWFKVDQFHSTPGTNDGNENALDDMRSWADTVSGDEPWGANPDPSPFVFIYSSSSCVNEDKPDEIGMEFLNELVEPAENQEEINTKAEVVALIEETQLSSQDVTLGIVKSEFSAVKDASDNADETAMTALNIAIVSLVFSSLFLGAFLGLVAWRMLKPAAFKRALLSDTASETKNEMGVV